MHAWDDLEARLRRDADTVRRAAQPGATLHHHTMARLTSTATAAPSPRAFRLPAQLLLAAALVVAVVVGVYVSGNRLIANPASHAPTKPKSPVPLPTAGALAPGTYFLVNPYRGGNPALNCNPGCAWYSRIIFTLPAGWSISDGLVSKHKGQPGEVAFSAWTVDQVYADPCHWQGSALSPLDLAFRNSNAIERVPPGPHDGGLANQALRGPLPRALTPVTIPAVDVSGLRYPTSTLRIDLSVPATLDIATCDKGQFRSWTVWEVPDGANSHNVSGQLDAVYQIDVDRRPLVIDASHMPGTSAADLAELQAIIASLVIDRS
jgi:hypothetical protein